jgi:hypothetical protein
VDHVEAALRESAETYASSDQAVGQHAEGIAARHDAGGIEIAVVQPAKLKENPSPPREREMRP